MHVIVVDDYASLSRVGADLVAESIETKPTGAIVPAMGNTPMGIYEELAHRRREDRIDTTHLRVFQLDAYLGLSPSDPRSLYGWLERSMLQPLGVPAANVVRLAGDSDDPHAVCRAYDAAVADAGGFDLAVLGLGPNGHLGFNEPPSDARSPTRVVDLTPESIESNARYWGGRDRVPRRAITAGMPQLLAARQTLLVVSGEHKQAVLRRTLTGPITPDVPASFLRQARNVTVIVDRAAWPADLPLPTG